MNKKIIAIAIAAAMAAPVAMADVKISGRFAGHLVSSDKNGTGTAADEGSSDLSFGESGASRLRFDGTSGNAFATIAYVAGASADGTLKSRDHSLGYKFAFGKVSFGRMGHAGKNIEKDPLVTTFLEIRKTNAEAVTNAKYGSSGFVDDVVQIAGKAGSMKYKVQFDPQNNTNRGTTGNFAIGLSGKAGPVGLFASYNNGDGTTSTTAATTTAAVTAVAGTAALGYTDYVKGVTASSTAASTTTVKQTNTKIGASMKFGSAKITLINQNSDDEGTKNDATALLAQIGLGKGLAVHVGAASGKKDGVKNTFSRLGVTKKVNKGFMIYAGITSSDADGSDAVTQTGVGAILKF